MKLKDKVALVTGGSRGIGAAIVEQLAREGAHVALTYVSKPDKAHKTAKVAQSLGVKTLAIQADSADPKAVVAAVERTVAELGSLDILVNNAGFVVFGPIEEIKLERMLTGSLRSMSGPLSSLCKLRCGTWGPAVGSSPSAAATQTACRLQEVASTP